MRKLRFGSKTTTTTKTQQPCSVTYSHGSWSWNQLGVERTGLAKILGFGGILKWKGKNKTVSFQRKKWDPISLTSGLHLWVLLKHLLISLYPFPILGKVPSNPSELPPGVDAFVLIGRTCDLIPSKVMRYGYIIKDTTVAHWREDSLIGFEKNRPLYWEGIWNWILPLSWGNLEMDLSPVELRIRPQLQPFVYSLMRLCI